MQKDPLVTNFSIKAFMSDQTNAVKVDIITNNHIVHNFSFYFISILLVMNNLLFNYFFLKFNFCNLFTPQFHMKKVCVQSGITDLIEHNIPKFKRFTKKQKIDLILRGVNIDNEEYLHVNTILTKAVQNYIITTNRFTSKEPPD